MFEVVIFGSRARGNATSDSDLDVLVVLDDVTVENAALKEIVYDAAWETGLQHKVVISTIIVTRHEVTETALRSSPLIQTIRKEGVVV